MEGVEARWVLQLCTEWIPDPRSRHAAVLKSKDRLRVDKMLIAQGGGSKAALVAALQGGISTAVGQPANAGNHFAHPRSFPSGAAAAATALPISKNSLGSLTLPFSAMAPAAPPHGKQGVTRGGGARRGTSRGGGKKNGKGRAIPIPAGLPTPQAAKARVDYNNKLKSLQQASLPHPSGYHCSDCALGGRNPHHQPHECACNECYNCQRGGHRTKHCQFPKYP